MATAPDGLKITRNKNKFSASWTNKKTKKKKVDKNSYERKINSNKKWKHLKTTKKAVSKATDFYTADFAGSLYAVHFHVKSSPEGSKAWSKWTSKTFNIKKPPAPSLSVEEGTYPSATFKYSVGSCTDSSEEVLYKVQWRTALQEKAGAQPNGATKWGAWANLSSSTTGSKTIVEDVGVIAGKNMTRWVQMRAKGPAGYNDSPAIAMRYGLPNEPTIIEDASLNSPYAKPDKSYFYVYFRYKIERSPSTPITSIMPQYYIGAPENQNLDPPSTGWTDTVTTLPTDGTSPINGAASFNTTNSVKNNQCLWVRVVSKNSDKQNQQTPSDPCLVYKGELSKPSSVDVGPVDTTSLRSIVKAKNESGVSGSFIAVYRLIDGKETCIGVIPNGKEQTVIQFDEMPEDPIIRLYTVAGYYEASSSFKKTTDTEVDLTKLYFQIVETNDENDYEEVATNGTENPAEEWWYERTGVPGNYNYSPTSDTEIVYTGYEAVEEPSGNPSAQGWYEHINDEYVPTTDTEVDEEKTYYIHVKKKYFKRVKEHYVLVNNVEGSPVLQKWYEIDGESAYSVDPKWKSDPVDTTTTIKVPQNITVGLATSNFSGNVRVNWDWPWKNADVAELSWSKNPDAWESTQEPSKYELTNSKPSSWVISDLETGTKWYIRVRLGVTGSNGISYGPYGNANPWPFGLTSYPATPMIIASKETITIDGETTISWVYSSADGTEQSSATLYEVIQEGDQTLYNEIDANIHSEQYVVIKPSDEKFSWKTGEEHTLAIKVHSKSESTSNYSNSVTIRVAEPAKCRIEDLSITDNVLRSMPISFSVIEDYLLSEDLSVDQSKNYYTRSDIAQHTYTAIGDIESTRYQEVINPEGNPSDQGWYEYVNDEYIHTQDTEIDEDKTYYVRFVENPKENGWYEQIEEEGEIVYILTLDTTMTDGKNYYVQNGEPEYQYTLKDNPEGNPHSNGYFERKLIDPECVVTASIKRAENFKQTRPDDSDFDGYEGETVYTGTVTNGSVFINIGDPNLIGNLDDRGSYVIEVNVKDTLGQTSKDETPFTIEWDHQAFSPTARVEIDQDNAVAFLYPIAPKSSIEYVLTTDEEIDDTATYYLAEEVVAPTIEDIETYLELSGSVYIYTTDTEIDPMKTYYLMEKVDEPAPEHLYMYYEYSTIDVCDIYRLSVDKPELIYQGAIFGETYVDPYPTIGEYGGHRFVCRTPNGDYITDDDEDAWIDTLEEDGDRFDSHANIVDFDGERAYLLYEVDLSNSWSKDFQETKYLGGSVQGDWNNGVSRSSSLNVTAVSDYDQDLVRTMHKLANYPGVCHIRTKDGSSYSADIQVNETYEYTRAPRFNKYDLSITRVDSETLDGMTLQEWLEEQGE